MENKIKHIEIIQSVISRMASNSFALKSWTVALVSATISFLAVSGKDYNKIYYLAVFVPIVTFWFLDSYYLMLERRYRSLYNIVRNKNKDDIDFSMNIGLPEIINNVKNCYCNCLFSISEVIFYFPLAFAILLFIILYN